MHGLPQVTLDLLQSYDVGAAEVPDEQLYLDEHGKVIDTRNFNETLAKVMNALPDPQSAPDQSFAEWIEKQSLDHNSKTIAMAYVEGFNAADARQIGIYALIQSANAADLIGGHRQFRLTKHYSTITTGMLNDSDPDLLEVHLNAVVASVHWQRNQVNCILRSGEGFTANSVIVTLPLPILQQNLVHFDPPLAEKKSCLEQLVMGHSQRLVYVFDSIFWDSITIGETKLEQLNFIDADDGPFRTWWTMYPLRSPVLVGWNSGPDVIPGASKDELIAVSLKKLAVIFDMSEETIRTHMVDCFYHDWSADEFSRGVYSYSRPGGVKAPEELAKPIQNTLFFAGEATDTEGNSGYAHGAIASGIRAAKELMESIPT